MLSTFTMTPSDSQAIHVFDQVLVDNLHTKFNNLPPRRVMYPTITTKILLPGIPKSTWTDIRGKKF